MICLSLNHIPASLIERSVARSYEQTSFWHRGQKKIEETLNPINGEIKLYFKYKTLYITNYKTLASSKKKSQTDSLGLMRNDFKLHPSMKTELSSLDYFFMEFWLSICRKGFGILILMTP